MKRFLSAALALSLLSGTAVYAEPYDHRGGHHERRDFDRDRHGGDRYYPHHRHHDDGAGAAIAVGIGLIALTAILASQDRDRDQGYEQRDRMDDRYAAPPAFPDDDAGPPPDDSPME